jgi:ABC-type glycerol-3-phosphate transport system substrate-binding protein
MPSARLSRRTFLGRTALATGAAVAAPYVRGAYAAGKLSCGFWDHWVPGANDTMTKLCQEWAAKERVELSLDFITGVGEKNRIVIMTEAQSRTGHDALAFPTWYASDQADKLVPLDDIMKALIEQHGPVKRVAEYLGKSKGHWIAVPATVGSQAKPSCARLDLMKQHAGMDVAAMYPAGAPANPALVGGWTWDAFLAAAEKCHKAGYPFGMPLGTLSDAVDWVGALFASYGAQLVDEEGKITVKSDQTRQALEWCKKLVPFLPPDVFAWDDASNNKWLIAGKGALIMNPPSAWAVAKRDAPQVAEQLWTFGPPAGPKGRYTPFLPYYWGIWNFSANQSAAKSLLLHLSQRAAVERFVAASSGYDLPPFDKLNDFSTWAQEAPPKGTLYHYPPRDDQITSIAAAPAPPNIANQIYTQATMTKMIARCTQGGDTIDKAIAWAADQLEGFMRT